MNLLTTKTRKHKAMTPAEALQGRLSSASIRTEHGVQMVWDALIPLSLFVS